MSSLAQDFTPMRQHFSRPESPAKSESSPCKSVTQIGRIRDLPHTGPRRPLHLSCRIKLAVYSRQMSPAGPEELPCKKKLGPLLGQFGRR